MKGALIMVSVYPVVFSPAKEGGYNVFVPDFPLNTQGKDMADAIYMARDAIAQMAIYHQDEGKEIPVSSELTSIEVKQGEFVTLIDVDFDEYRRKYDNRTERRNVTLPRWLNSMAKEQGLNVSEILTEALKERLQG